MSTRRVKFGDVVLNLNETVRSGAEHSLTRVVGLEHIDSGDPELRRWDELSSLPDGTSFTRVFRRGQVLFGKRRAYQRKVVVASFDGICSSDILVFAPRSKDLHPDFMLYVVQSDGFFAHAMQTSSGSLSPRTRWQDLAAFEFDLPSFEEQQRIIEVMTAVDEHAKSLRNQLVVLDNLRKSVLFHRLTAGGGDWTESTLGDLLIPISERADKKSDYVVLSVTEKRGIIPQAEVFNRRIATDDVSKYKVLHRGDIAYNPYLLWCGAIGQWKGSDPGVVSPVYECFRTSEANSSAYLGLIFESGILTPYFDTTAIGSIQRRRRTTLPVFNRAGLLMPPLDVQERIVDEVSKIDTLIQETTSSLAATSQLRSALLDKEIS
jgi:type I restriction enzyme S subunit